MQDAVAIKWIKSRYAALASLMDERMRRQWAAAEAISYGWGGRRAVSRATGMALNTIAHGWAELKSRKANHKSSCEPRLRKPGGGRKRTTAVDPELSAHLERLRRWWNKMGSKRHRGVKRLLITADGGGSNGSRRRLWKVALQNLAEQLGMPIHVCDFPPGTSK